MTVVRTPRAQARVDLGAVEHNVKTLRQVAGVPVMAVVKADGYGHGAVPVALAAKAAGAEWLGVAFLDEALELRANGVPGPVLAWLLHPADAIGEALDQDIDLSVTSLEVLQAIAAAARQRGIRARVHVEVDTGLSRAGVAAAQWREFFDEVSNVAADVELISVWSHLACADEPQHPANARQQQAYETALNTAAECGLNVQLRHLANSAGALAHPALRYDLVRCGIATYGVTPGGELADASDLGLRPAMTVIAEIADVRRLNAGDSVSYSHRWTAATDTTVALIPIGYADGIPRAATNVGSVMYRGHRLPIVGTVCMDQFVVDCGALSPARGETVVVFGADAQSAHAWAQSAGSIGYEVVTRLGARIERSYTDGVQ